jgi:putative FmdB family regulatory protein
MPTYDYRCPAGHDFEQFFRKISDASGELACPVCGAVAARRVSGGAGLLFKGSGFYLTDYGKNAHRKPGDTPKGDGKSEGKTESKPESAKSESGGNSTDSGSGTAKANSGKPSESKSSTTKSSGGDAT